MSRSLLLSLFAALTGLTFSCTASTESSSSDPSRGGKTDDGSGESSTKIRIATSNLTTGDNQNYDGGEGIRILQGIHPDIVLVQEFNYHDNAEPSLQEFANAVVGDGAFYYRQTLPPEVEHAIPNGIVSRYPILESGSWDDLSVTTREYAWARLDIPGDKDLYVLSLHLITSKKRRAPATVDLVSQIKANIPEDAYLVLGGDFNTSSRGEPTIQTLSEVVVTDAPYPTDGTRDKTNFLRNEPYDWLLADTEFDAFETPVVIGSQTFPNGLVVDTRVFEPIEDLAPALATDSAAPEMQHMSVVRDFELPN